MIYGIGIDLVSCQEFIDYLQERKSTFFQKTFTLSEQKKCKKWSKTNRRAQCLSVRYAAKEALLKALDGPRLFQRANFSFLYNECEIRNDGKGRPYFFFYGSLFDYMREQKIIKSHLTLSHIRDYAIAHVILEDASDLPEVI